jgi:Aminopeptidase P, N-terminal domain
VLQESFFHWSFGVLEPAFYGAIVVGTGETILFAPHLPADYDVVMGPIATNGEWRQRYAVDRVHNTNEVNNTFLFSSKKSTATPTFTKKMTVLCLLHRSPKC